jgi:exodeoxyribonuclease VII large subunit
MANPPLPLPVRSGLAASLGEFFKRGHSSKPNAAATLWLAPPQWGIEADMAESQPATNAPELSVTELSSALKRTIEDRFAYVRVRGEISNYRGPHSSGHLYFCLKDQGARIDAVIWKSAFARLRMRPEEGMEVIATGRITTFPGKSAYQIIVEAMEPAGIGALMALLEARRVKFAGEGLFDAARKKRLPYLPRVIGVVTSPTGAVIRDILHRLSDRFPVHVLVWPVRVQGETSAAEVAGAIAGFNALEAGGAIPRPDVLIVARGGGSLEDLWSFNEEIVVRAAAQSAIPLVAAIGHETDWTLIDHVADIRAPTPTAAAELSAPVRAELLANLADLEARRRGAILRVSERARAAFRAAARALLSGEAILALPRQRLDRAGAALAASTHAGFNRRAIGLERLSRRLAVRSPQALLASAAARQQAAARSLNRAMALDRDRRRERLGRLAARLTAALAARSRFDAQQLMRTAQAQSRLRRALQTVLAQRRQRLAAAAQFLNAVSYRNVLRRGFALVRDSAGGLPMRSAAAISAGQALRIEFADGEVGATADGAGAPEAGRAPRKTAARLARSAGGKNGQGSLF